MSLENAKGIALAGLEGIAKELVMQEFDSAFEQASQKLKDLIPGEKFDVVVDVLKVQFQAKLKEQLLAQVEKIHEAAV